MMKISFRNNILFLVFQALYAFLFFFFLKNVDSVASSEYKVSFKGNENRGSYGQIGYRPIASVLSKNKLYSSVKISFAKAHQI